MRLTGGNSEQPTPLTHALAAVRRHFVWAAGFSALLNLLFLAPMLYMLQVYDRVVPTQGKLTLLFLTIVVLFAIATLSALEAIRSRLLVRASIALDRQLSGAIMDATLARPGTVSQQALREFDTLRQTMTGAGILALFDAPWTPIYLIVCFLIHPALGALAIAGGAVLLLITARNEKATKEPLQQANQATAAAYLSQEQTAAAGDVVRALGMRQAMVVRHLRERELSLHLQAQASFSASGYLTLTKFFRLALQSIALGLGALLAVDNQISAGAIFAASFLVSRALAPLEQVIGAWRNVVQARGAYRTLQDLFAQAPPGFAPTQLPPPRGHIQVEHLTVLSAGRDSAIINDINFVVEPGEVVAIVGPSGAGKSTLVRMIAGAGLPDRGSVRFDGADSKDWDPERLARHIGYLPQEASLLPGTVKDNIARFSNYLGSDLQAIDSGAVEAAKACGAHDMILRLPQGYDSVLGLGGRGLSAGQAQRVALARALFGSPAVLILDEPNAHLDSEGEASLVTTLGQLKARGTSILIVAHRVGVLAAVDKLLVLRDGRIEMYGPRDEILRRITPAPQPAVANTAAKV